MFQYNCGIFFSILFSSLLTFSQLTPGPSAKSSANSQQSSQTQTSTSSSANRPSLYNPSIVANNNRPQRYNSENKKNSSKNSNNQNNPERDPGNPNNTNKLGGKNWYDGENNTLNPSVVRQMNEKIKKDKIQSLNLLISQKIQNLNINPTTPTSQLSEAQITELSKIQLAQMVLNSDSFTHLAIDNAVLKNNNLSTVELASLILDNSELSNSLVSELKKNKGSSKPNEGPKIITNPNETFEPNLKKFEKYTYGQIIADPKLFNEMIFETTKAQTINLLNQASEENKPAHLVSEVNLISNFTVFQGGYVTVMGLLSEASSKDEFQRAKNLAESALISYDKIKSNAEKEFSESELTTFKQQAETLKSLLSNETKTVKFAIGEMQSEDGTSKTIDTAYAVLPKEPTGEVGINRKITVEVQRIDPITKKITVVDKAQFYPDELSMMNPALQKILKIPPAKDIKLEPFPNEKPPIKKKFTDEVETELEEDQQLDSDMTDDTEYSQSDIDNSDYIDTANSLDQQTDNDNQQHSNNSTNNYDSHGDNYSDSDDTNSESSDTSSNDSSNNSNSNTTSTSDSSTDSSSHNYSNSTSYGSSYGSTYSYGSSYGSSGDSSSDSDSGD